MKPTLTDSHTSHANGSTGCTVADDEMNYGAGSQSQCGHSRTTIYRQGCKVWQSYVVQAAEEAIKRMVEAEDAMEFSHAETARLRSRLTTAETELEVLHRSHCIICICITILCARNNNAPCNIQCDIL